MKPFGVFLIALITSAITSAGVFYAENRWHILKPPEQQRQVVPDLRGLTEPDAKTNLDALGLKMMVAGREASAEAKEGTVLSQVPRAGETVGPDQTVSLTFAIAATKPVPDVVGKPVADATKALEEAGYTVKVGDPVADAKVAAGMVVSQTPGAGTTLKAKETVTLQPSSGAGEVEVPKLTGMNQRQAEEEAKKVGLKVAVNWVALAETATFVVLRQDPVPGTKVKPDSEVKIYINR
jgi:serine/threonine-protein kinase